MILVDSSVWIDYFRGTASRKSEFLARQIDDGGVEIVAGDLIVAEVLQGFRSEKQAREAVAAFDLIETVDIGGRTLAVKSARNYRLLRAKGVTVRSTIDCLIATFCIERRIRLLHDDRDYEPFARHLGLRVAVG
ncbi:MAG: PIN domain nuclease [Betaproteobacteria bacterium]|nr:PIN domain nuclease [Betaproteobacteria bacterium]